jgi:hypothetical protein
MTMEQLKAFEQWLLGCYQENPNVDFATLSAVLKVARAQAK